MTSWIHPQNDRTRCEDNRVASSGVVEACWMGFETRDGRTNVRLVLQHEMCTMLVVPWPFK